MEKLQQILQRNQRERFENLSPSAKRDFFNGLITEDNLGPEQAKRVYSLFETGEAGSVDEALEILRAEEKQDSHSHR